MTERIKDTLLKDAERRTAAQALKAMRECTDIARTRDIIAAISQEITQTELAKIFVKEIRDDPEPGKPKSKFKAAFLSLYMEMVARVDRADGTVTQDDASQLADDQIEYMIAQHGYGTCPKCGYNRALENGQEGIHGTDGAGESGAPCEVAGTESAVG